MRTASVEESGPSLIRSFNSVPSTNSITMNGSCDSWPFASVTVSSPASNTRTIVGWAIRAAACAS